MTDITHEEDIVAIKKRIAAYEAAKQAENEAHVRAVATVGSQVGRLRYDVHERFGLLNWLVLTLIVIEVASKVLDLYLHDVL